MFYHVLVRPLFQIYRDAFSGLSRELWVLGIAALLTAERGLIVAPSTGTYVYELFGRLTLWHRMGVVGVGLWVSSVVLKPYLRG